MYEQSGSHKLHWILYWYACMYSWIAKEERAREREREQWESQRLVLHLANRESSPNSARSRPFFLTGCIRSTKVPSHVDTTFTCPRQMNHPGSLFTSGFLCTWRKIVFLLSRRSNIEVGEGAKNELSLSLSLFLPSLVHWWGEINLKITHSLEMCSGNVWVSFRHVSKSEAKYVRFSHFTRFLPFTLCTGWDWICYKITLAWVTLFGTCMQL